jgi:hypothetical protein
LFQKRIYSIFFGTKAGKRKLSILKERWFDIAIPDAKNPKSVVEESRAAAVECPEDIQLAVNRS